MKNECRVLVEGLEKRYGDFLAVDGVNLKVYGGEIFGLLGPNGAGKTTTLECLIGLREGDRGNIEIMGIDPRNNGKRLRQVTGMQLQVSALPDTIKVGEALRFFSFYHKQGWSQELLQRFNLQDKERAPYYSLSQGQKMRLSLMLAMAHRPPVLILDEPTAGLDVASRRTLHTLIRELRDQGTTIIVSTHDMAEAEELTDRVAIMVRGRVLLTGTPREITATGKGWTKILVKTELDSLKGRVIQDIQYHEEREGYQMYLTHEVRKTMSRILACIEGEKDEIVDLRVERPTLEERFIELTEREKEEIA